MNMKLFIFRLFPCPRFTGIMVSLIFLSVASPASSAGELFKKNKKHIVFLISEDPDNYEAHRTIPAFAEDLRREYGFRVTVLLGKGPRNAYAFPNLDVLRSADLLVVFCRRLALSPAQLGTIRKYFQSGKPVIGLRTANHAFSVREDVQDGYEAWWEFVPEILGCENKGYGPIEPGTKATINNEAKDHPVLEGVPASWHTKGNLYLVSPLLDPDAVVLIQGTADGKVEPIAWTRTTSTENRVFYTSMGYPDDFDNAAFRTLLINGIHWALAEDSVKQSRK